MVNLNKKLTLSRVCGKLLNMRLYMRKFYSEHTKMRTSGILLHISSLPSDYGIGTFGREAYRFVDFLSKAGQTYWQILPIGITSFGDSPDQSFSSFAGNPYFIDPDRLMYDGYLEKADIAGLDFGSDPEKADFGKLYESRYKMLRTAYKRF